MPQQSIVTPLNDPQFQEQHGYHGPFSNPSPVKRDVQQIGYSVVGTTITGTNLAGLINVTTFVNSSGVRRRVAYVKNTTDKVVHLVFQASLSAAFNDLVGTVTLLDITLAAGNVNPQTAYITSAGAMSADASSAAPVLVAGSYAGLDVLCDSFKVGCYAAVAPTLGALIFSMPQFPD